MKKIVALISISFIFSACAYFPDVRPGNDGTHRVVVTDADKENGQRQAIRQANSYCDEKQNKTSAAIVQEETKYTGDMDEKTYINARRASTVATVGGGGAAIFGGKKEQNVGGAVALGGVVAGAAIGKGYTVDIRFKCK